jgi:hypothetical protein
MKFVRTSSSVRWKDFLCPLWKFTLSLCVWGDSQEFTTSLWPQQPSLRRGGWFAIPKEASIMTQVWKALRDPETLIAAEGASTKYWLGCEYKYKWDTFAKVFTLSLWGVVCRWVRKKSILILNSGCNTTKCGISQGVWILSEGTVVVMACHLLFLPHQPKTRILFK